MAITLVGSASSDNNGGNNVTVPMPAGVAQGDVSYVIAAEGSTTDINLAMATAGYAELADVYGNDTLDSNLAVYRKVQGSTPDSNAVTDNSEISTNSTAAIIYLLRGVDTTTPEDATTTIASAPDDSAPNAPSITTVTPNAWVLACGATTEAADTATAPANYSDLVQRQGQADNNPIRAMIARREIASPGAEDPAAFGGIAGQTSDSWAAATVAVRPAAEAAVLSFGWYEQAGKSPSPPRAPASAFAMAPQPFVVAPTVEFGWFVPWASPRATRKLPDNSFVRAPIEITAPSLAWFEPYAKAPAPQRSPASAVVLPPQPYAVVTLTTEIGWFEPYAPRPPAGKGPASTVAWDPQVIGAAPTLTTDIGWFEPYAKRPPVGKAPDSATVMDPQIVAAAPTLTTDIGWFEPFSAPPKAARKIPDNSFSRTSVVITAPPLGWFEAYAQRPPIVRAPASVTAIAPQPFAVITLTTSIGWYTPYALRPPAGKAPASSIVMAPQELAGVVPVTPPVPLGGGVRRVQLGPAAFGNTVKVHWGPVEAYARVAFDVVYETAPRWPEKPVQAVPLAPAPPKVIAPIAVPEKDASPPAPIFAGWVAVAGVATLEIRRVMVDNRPVAAAKRRKMAGYVEAAQAHDRKLIRDWLKARGINL